MLLRKQKKKNLQDLKRKRLKRRHKRGRKEKLTGRLSKNSKSRGLPMSEGKLCLRPKASALMMKGMIKIRKFRIIETKKTKRKRKELQLRRRRKNNKSKIKKTQNKRKIRKIQIQNSKRSRK